jgi:hypothetical protein
MPTEGLDTSQVYKCLEKKMLILGFEIVDLFLLGILFCILNFVFSSSSLKLFLTFLPVLIAAIALRLLKHGKADNYFLHLVRFYIFPGLYHAFPLATDENQFAKLKRKTNAQQQPRKSP